MRPRDGFIYFIRAGDLVKIGFSTNPPKRFASFRALLPSMTVLGVHAGTMAEEKLLHKLFADQHVTHEWFKHSDALEEAAKAGLTDALRSRIEVPAHFSRCNEPNSALIEKAIELAGSEAKLGEATGYSQHGIWKAKRTGSVSPELALAIHKFSDGKIPASELRPDLWSAPEHVPVEAPSIAPDQEQKDTVRQ